MSKTSYVSKNSIARLLKEKKIKDTTAEGYIRDLRKLSEEIDQRKTDIAAKIFSAMSDPVRIRILKLLERRKICVCEFAVALNMRQPAVSYHLKILQDSDLIESMKVGKWIFYKLSDKKIVKMIMKLLNAI